MAYRNLIYSHTHPYHIYCRTNNRDPFPLPLKDVWEIFSFCLRKVQAEYDFDVLAFVMMNNHYHLLGQCSEEYPLSKAMHSFQMHATRIITSKANRINRIFGGPYQASQIKQEYHFANIYKYIAQNPLRAHLVDSVDKYPYSTFSSNFDNFKFLVKNAKNGFDILIPQEKNLYSNWLNQPIQKESIDKIRIALKKANFKYKKINKKDDPLNLLLV